MAVLISKDLESLHKLQIPFIAWYMKIEKDSVIKQLLLTKQLFVSDNKCLEIGKLFRKFSLCPHFYGTVLINFITVSKD